MRAFHGMPVHSRGWSRRRNGSRTCLPLLLPLISVQPLSQITNLRGARKRPGLSLLREAMSPPSALQPALSRKFASWRLCTAYKAALFNYWKPGLCIALCSPRCVVFKAYCLGPVEDGDGDPALQRRSHGVRRWWTVELRVMHRDLEKCQKEVPNRLSPWKHAVFNIQCILGSPYL